LPTVLVTGAAGFIGSHVVEALLARGDRVVGLDNFDPFYDRAAKERNLRGALARAAYRFVEGDIRDAELVDSLLAEEPVTHIVHLAAKAGVRPSLRDPIGYLSANVAGTLTLLEAARSHGVERFVFGSSSSVYGAASRVPFAEDQDISRPISPYAASKVACEVYCHAYHHLYAIPMAVLRFFTVYGPRQRPDLAVSKFVRLLSAREPVPMYGDGTSSRDYTFIGDIVAGVLAALDATFAYETVNLGSSSPVALIDLIRAVGRTLGVPVRIEPQPTQPGDVPRTYASVEKARRLLGWQPTTALEEGLKRYVEWVKAQ
jgi:UDP-glucuronate 4-epimerase